LKYVLHHSYPHHYCLPLGDSLHPQPWHTFHSILQSTSTNQTASLERKKMVQICRATSSSFLDHVIHGLCSFEWITAIEGHESSEKSKQDTSSTSALY
jgi:hypothetical protein